MKRVNKSDYKNCDKIYVTSLLTPDTDKKREIKSPDNLLCYARSTVFKSNKDFQGKEFIIIDRINNLPLVINDQSMIFLVDDFIGTGETAESAIIYLFSNRKDVNINKVKVFALYSLNEGLQKVKATGVEVFIKEILQKGISDFYDSPEKEQKIDLMLSIENIINGLSPYFNLGYQKSEALISIGRTPDNTFPVYWKGFKKNGEFFEAPFQRD